MVHQIILSRFDIWRSGEVNSVRFTHILDLLPTSSQANQIRMELLQVRLQYGRGISCRITGDEYRQHDIPFQLLLDDVNHLGHLVQLLGADVGAVCEAEIDEGVSSFQIFRREWLSVMVKELKGTPNFGFANSLCGLCDALTFHPSFFIPEVEDQTYSGEKEE